MKKAFKYMLLIGLMFGTSLTMAANIAQVKFIVGSVTLERQGEQIPLNKGDHLQPGDRIQTNANSQVFFDTIDQGIIALKANTQIYIQTYQYDSQAPQNTKIKIDLIEGVMRSVSGKGAQASKKHYRLNTPVAALGIRGTDFTVYANHEISRAAVASGGIVMTPYSDSCPVDSFLACDNANTVALMASKETANTLLEMNIRMEKPALVQNDDQDVTSEKALQPKTSVETLPSIEPGSQLAIDSQLVRIPSDLDDLKGRNLYWGKWQTYANLSADQVTERLNELKLVGFNNMFIIAQDQANFILPNKGQASFQMTGSEAYVVYPFATDKPIAANVTDEKLTVNFDSRSFDTSLKVDYRGLTIPFYASGSFDADGHFIIGGEGNGAIAGTLGGVNADQAVYIFSTNAKDNLYQVQAIGATAWQQKP